MEATPIVGPWAGCGIVYLDDARAPNQRRSDAVSTSHGGVERSGAFVFRRRAARDAGETLESDLVEPPLRRAPAFRADRPHPAAPLGAGGAAGGLPVDGVGRRHVFRRPPRHRA